MSDRVNEKINLVLRNISEKNVLIGLYSPIGIEFDSDELVDGLAEYQTGWVEPKMLDNLALLLDGLVNRGLLESVENLERYRINELHVVDRYNLILPIDFSEKVTAYLNELSGEYAVSVSDKKTSKLKLEINKNSLYLVGDKNKKRVRISDDVKSRQARLFKHLFAPELGLYKTTESTLEAMGDSDVPDGESLIKGRFKEIQSILSTNNTKTRFKLVFKNNKVAMVIR